MILRNCSIREKDVRCPCYVSKEIHKDANILFGPYNYVIDHGYRDSVSFNWNNMILMFDEAHNLVWRKAFNEINLYFLLLYMFLQ